MAHLRQVQSAQAVYGVGARAGGQKLRARAREQAWQKTERIMEREEP